MPTRSRLLTPEDLIFPISDQFLEEIRKEREQRALQQAIEEEARRKAEEWIRQRPWWQKAIDIVAPGEQFRTPGETLPESIRRAGRAITQFLEGFATTLRPVGAEMYYAQYPERRAAPPETPAEQAARTAGQLAAIAAQTYALSPIAKAALTPVGRSLAPAARAVSEAWQQLPRAAQVAAGTVGAITATEALRGITRPEAKEQTLPARFAASLRAGFGDILSLTGTIAERLRQERLGASLKAAGERLKRGYEIQPVEFSWKSFFNPDWYAVNVARSLPLTLSLIPAMYVGYKAGAGIGTRMGLGPFYRAILGSLVGAGTSRLLEASFEAASAYEDYLQKHPGDVKGAERAADATFRKNLLLMGLDALQLGTMFVPVSWTPVSRIGRALRAAGKFGLEVGTEALEEAAQEVFQRQAEGEPVTFDAQMKEAMAMGALFGAGFGGAAHLIDYIREYTLSKLPENIREKVSTEAEKQIEQGVEFKQAVDNALNQVMAEDPSAAKIAQKAVDEAVDRIDRQVKAATAATKRKTPKEKARQIERAIEEAGVVATPEVPEAKTKAETAPEAEPSIRVEKDVDLHSVFQDMLKKADTAVSDEVIGPAWDSLTKAERFEILKKGYNTRNAEWIAEKQWKDVSLADKAAIKTDFAQDVIRTVQAKAAPVTQPEPAAPAEAVSVATTEPAEQKPKTGKGLVHSRIVQRGKRGAVRVVFPDEAHARLFDFNSQLRKAIDQGKEFDVEAWADFLRHNLNLSPDTNVGAVSEAYRMAILDAVKDLPKGEVYNAPRLDEVVKKGATGKPKATEVTEARTAEARVRPEAGGTYRVRIVKSTGSLKEGQEFTGRVEKIFKARSGAVLAKLVADDGTVRNIPVSKYAEWYQVTAPAPAQVEAPAAVTEGERRREEVPPKAEAPAEVLPTEARPAAELISALVDAGATHFRPSPKGTSVMVYRPSPGGKGYGAVFVSIEAPHVLKADTGQFVAVKEIPEEARPIGELQEYVDTISNRMAELNRLWDEATPEKRYAVAQGIGLNEQAASDAATRLWAELPITVKNDLVYYYDTVAELFAAPTGERTAEARPAKAETEYKPGERVTWRGVGGTYTGTIRSVLVDGKLEIEVDQTETAGGVPIGHIAVVSPDNPTLRKIATPEEASPTRAVAKEEKRAETAGAQEKTAKAQVRERAGEATGQREAKAVRTETARPGRSVQAVEEPAMIEAERREEERVSRAPERRGTAGEALGARVEGRGEAVLGEVATEVERRAEEREEVRGDTEPARSKRTEDVEQGVPRPEREARSEKRERPPEEGRTAEGRRLHGRGASEEDVAVAAARERSAGERGRNYVITDEDKLEEGGPKTKAKNNIEAIKLLKKLEEEGRMATPEEQKVLAKFNGWGSCWQVFDPYRHPEFRELNRELKSILTTEEYYAASRSTQNAHYTSPEIIKAMWEAARRLGFKGGRVLEPAVGAGYFFGLMPPDLARKSRLVGVELDPIPGKIASHLYPEAKIYIQGFEETTLPDNFFDLAISNVPFGDIRVVDPKYPKYLTEQIHNYFFAKALDKVRPGGLVMFITSIGTMDARTNRRVREYLASKADLIGAIRLPGGTFKGVAQTEVTTDIIILRKRAEGEEPAGEAWIESKESGLIGKDGSPLYINEYFINHPEMIIGNLVEDKLHPGRIAVDGTGFDVPAVLRKMFERLPENVITETPKTMPAPKVDREILEGQPSLAEGTITIRNGKVYQIKEGSLVEVTGKNAPKIKALAEIRDAALEVLGTQYRGEPDQLLKEAQKKLNQLYDAFVKKYGPVYNHLDLFRNDPNAHILESLETVEVDPRTKKVKSLAKADIFTKRTIRGIEREVKAETAAEALIVSLNETGRVDLRRMAELTGKSEEELARDLEGRIFKNPETGEWETAEQYLSGNVRAKLKAARAAAEIDPAFEKNVKALENVQPRDLEPHEIRVTFGAPWIPPEYVKEFLGHILQISPFNINVTKNPATQKWKIEITGWAERNVKYSKLNTEVYGTHANPAVKLVEKALNKDLPVEWTEVGEGKKVIDPEKTELAREKQRQLEMKFAQWLWSDPDRAKNLAQIYNETYNNLRLVEYDGSHLTFPGLNEKITPWPHQKNAVWRILTAKSGVLIAHGVGKGKTLTMTMAAMELRRLGIAKKPMFVVPTNLFEQWVKEFKRYYPTAKVLALSAKELPGMFAEKKAPTESEEAFQKRREEHARKRKAALMRIATGDWDAVIITDTAFTRLPVSPEFERSFIQKELEALRDHLETLRKERGDRRTIKQIEKTIQNYEAKLKEDISEIKKDMVMPFEELGVDWLFVDEAHAYKRLPFHTKMSNVMGVPTGESQRAMDMYLKTRYILQLNNGRGVVFATGTPITNTMAEMYNLMRYLAPHYLEQINASHFDDWASVFTALGDVWEAEVTGQAFKKRAGLKSFINLAELLKLYHSFADVVPNTPDDPNIPKLKGGSRTLVMVEPSEDQQRLIEWCIDRLQAIKLKKVDPTEDNVLKVCVDANKIALDPRLIDPKLPDNPNSKLNRAVQNIFEIWQRTKGSRSTQLVFLDLSVPKRRDTAAEEGVEAPDAEVEEEAKENVILYNDIKRKLVSLGVPPEEIAFIHEAKNRKQKEALCKAVNEGKIRILIGSTGKMGIGLNIQKKLIALHHLDCPWRPDEIEQREGRILRPGNENHEVEIYVYGTQRTFDVVRWNKVVYKANFIAQTLAKGTEAREIENLGDVVVLGYEEARAAVTGNPLIEEKAKVDGEVLRLQRLKQAYAENIRQMRRSIAELEARNKDLTGLIENWEKDLKRRKDTSGDKFTITILGQTYTNRKEANEALRQAVNRIPFPKDEVESKQEIGSFAGFNLSIRKTRSYTSWELEGASRYAGLVAEDPVRSMEATLRTIEKRIGDAREEIKSNESEIVRLQQEIEKPFPEEERLQEMLARQRQINIQLGIGEGLATDVVANTEPDDNGMYALPELEKLRGEADRILASRIKGEPKQDVYALPLYAPQKTSVKQVARGLRLGVEKGIFKKGMVVADVGGGLYDEGTRYLAEHGITNLVYDPYARSQEHNEMVLRTLYDRGGADAVALNNVLNVIPKAEDRESVLKFAYGLLKNGGQMIVTVYEGDRSGKGSMKEFKDGTYTWQENRKLDDYESEIRRALPNAVIEKKYNAYIITKPQLEKEYEFYALAKPKQPVRPVQLLRDPSKLSPKAARKIAEKLTEALDTAIMATRPTGPLKGKRAVYAVKPHAVRTRKKYISHWRTVGHELGHAFKQYTSFKPDTAEMTAIVNEMYPGGVSQVKDVDHEGFAEFLMLYFADNARAKQLAPKTYDQFERLLLSNPELKQVIDEARAIAEEDLEGTPLARAGLYVASRTENPTAIGTYEVPWWKRPTFSFLDGSIPLRDLYEEAVKKGYTGLDPAKMYACSGMAWDKAVEIFKTGVVYQQGGRITPGKRSLVNILKEAEQVPNGLVLLDRILRAFHSLERQERGIETALPREEAEAIVEQAKKEYPELVKLAKEYSETLSETCLRMLVDGGVISAETADRIRKAYQWYMPLYVRKPASRVRKEPLRGSGPGVIRAKGHVQEELPLIEATLLKIHDTVQAVELNRMMQAVEESLKLPNMGKFGLIVEKPVIAKKMQLGTVLEQIEQFLGEEIDVDDPKRIITLFMPGFEGDLRRTEPIVVARHGDKEVYMQLAPDLFEAIQSLRPISYNMLVKILSTIGAYGRAGALLNIRFVTNNMARDLFQSAIQSKTTFERSMVLGYLKGALTAAGLGEKAEKIMNLYIQSGAYGSAAQEVLKSMMRSTYIDGLRPTPVPGWKRTATGILARIINTPLDLLRIQEEAPRVAEFVAVLEKELKKHNLTVDDVIEGNVPGELRLEVEKALLEAAYASREVIVNFGLHGTHEGFRTYVRCVPFLQGSLQGIYRSYRMMREQPGEALKRWLVYVVPITLIAWALSHKDDRYRDMDSEARDRYWWFPVGDGIYFALAKPYEYALPANLLERLLDWIYRNGDNTARKPLEDFANAVKQAFGVPLMPMVVQTIWDLARNRDALGVPIEPMREQNLPPEYRYGPGTTKAARMLATIAARIMGDSAPSPRQIEYFVEGTFGGLGTLGLRLASLEFPFGSKRAGIEYAPFIGPLLYGPMESGSRIVDRFYKDYDRAQKLYNAYRLYNRPLTPYEAKLVSAIPAMRAIADMLADLRRGLRKIELDETKTLEEKRRAALIYNWVSRTAAGYLYSHSVPATTPEMGLTEADVQDILRYIEQKVETYVERAEKREGGPR